MAKKRKTLVSNFKEILKSGNLEELTAVFDKCEINATTDRYGPNAFGCRPLSSEFAYWLKEQGADINFIDYYGEAAVFHQVSMYDGNLKLMIELGADINLRDRSGGTLLHTVASHGTKDDILLLLSHGLDINEKQLESSFFSKMKTPLEILFEQNNGGVSEVLKKLWCF